MSTIIKDLQRSIQPGSSTNQHTRKPHKTNIQVKVALIGALSVIIAAIITAILGPALINWIATPTPTPLHVVGQPGGTINSTPPGTDKNTSKNRNNVHGNNNQTNIRGSGNSTNIQGNGNTISSGP